MKFMTRGNIMQNWIFSIFPNQNFVDLGLFQFGWERCAPAHSFGPAARNHYLFHYILSGTGTLMADDSKGVTQTYSIKSMQVHDLPQSDHHLCCRQAAAVGIRLAGIRWTPCEVPAGHHRAFAGQTGLSCQKQNCGRTWQTKCCTSPATKMSRPFI